MVLNVNDFKAKLGGGVRSNLFKITLVSPVNGLEVSGLSTFLAKTGELPGSTITPIILPYRGRQLKISGDKTFDPWTVTVMNDPNFTIRKSLEIWMSGINNHEDGQGSENYFVDLKIESQDRNGNTLRAYSLKDAWPSDLGPIAVSFDNENQLQEYQVTFQYQYWTAGAVEGASDLIEGGDAFGTAT